MTGPSFKDFVLDQLRALSGLRAKRMFGGYGLYQGARFFGILMDGRLFFKTDAQTRDNYITRGAAAFVYEKGKRIVSTHYYEVPPEILENAHELFLWATRAINAAAQADTGDERTASRKSSRKPTPRKPRV